MEDQTTMLVSMTDSNQLRISGRIDAGNAAELEKQMLEECLPEMTAQCADKEITIDVSGSFSNSKRRLTGR